MKKYKVNVNGTMYEITLEVCDADEVSSAPTAPVSPTAPAAPAASPAPAAAPAGGETVKSPMPGTILDVKVQNGQTVKEGDLLFILEAMKMENEIFAPCSGVVTVLTSKGSTVDTGSPLASIA